MTATETPMTLLFDLGGVLVDWDSRYLYRKLFPDEASMEAFLARVCTPAWNLSIDAGKPFAQAIAERQALFPDQSEFIAFWRSRWDEMLRGQHEGTVALLAELRAQGHDLCALTNWSAETFPIAEARFPWLSWFREVVVSGRVGLAKPDPACFRLALDRCGLDPARTLFIDDSPANVEAARALGLAAHRFTSAEALRAELEARGLLPVIFPV